MTSAAENELMTRTGAGSPAGALLREYWQPVALAAELDGARQVLGVKLFGEELVLFRDEEGRLGLMERGCPHRGADLCFGRLEDGGLRCPFHGWLFDVNGQCLEQPAEPADSRAYLHLRHRSYPCQERSGVIFAYLGRRSAPAWPAFDCFQAPGPQTFAFKGLWECNWLQALEVGIDPAHASFLHRFLEDEPVDAAYGRQFRAVAADSGVPLTKILREHARPDIRTEDTNFGFRLITTRALPQQLMHYRITNLVFPNAIVIPMSNDMTITQWHVPIDDVSCFWYSIFTSFGAAVDRDKMRRQRLENHELPSYRPIFGRANRWGFDAAEQARSTYTGMGTDINVHDQWAVESPGPIVDRSKEHLGKSDAGIIRYRKLLHSALHAEQQGKGAPFVFDAATAATITGPVAVDAIGPAGESTDSWVERDRERRRQCSWAALAD
jgi:phenylpropionate dioxygenase-like ring-hydroxylating dioxygenase large terminal subunit